MEITTVCTMLLCASISDYAEYPNYNIELRLEDLGHRTNQHLQHVEYLSEVKDFNILNQLQDALRDHVVERSNVALGKIHTQVVVDELSGKKPDVTCYEEYKEYIVNAAKDGVYLVEPCLSKLEHQMIDLSTKVQIRTATAELLTAELEQVRNTCSVKNETEHGVCYETGLDQIAIKLEESKQELNKLYELYNLTLRLVPEGLECIRQAGNDVQLELDGILQNAVQCQESESLESE